MIRMAVSKAFITDTELDLLKVLWSAEPATAREIARLLYDDETASAIGTVQKLIQRLEDKQLIARDRSESVHRFSSRVSRDDVAGLQLQGLAEKLSDGSLLPFISHLVRAERLSRKDRQALRKLLDEC